MQPYKKMEKYLNILKRSEILLTLSEAEILSALNCLGAEVKSHTKNTILFSEGDEAKYIGIVLDGEIQVQKLDYSGNINMISRLFPSEIIGASAFFSTDKRLPFDIICSTDSTIMQLNSQKLMRQCCNSCLHHSKIISNLLSVIADKNMQLTEKINILTKRSMREKIMAYLYSISKKAKNKKFAVNLSRRQMADFLSINRSAMIRELGIMREEGLIDFEDNIFWLN